MERQTTHGPIARRPIRSAATRSRTLVVALGVVALATAACGSSQSAAGASATGISAAQPPVDASGTLIDIGGRNVFVQCAGTGSPTVMLISGNPIAADLWDSPLGAQPTVYQTIAKRTRVCAYDRPGTTRAIEGGGFSRSDPVAQPITAADSVTELHDLLAAMGEQDPVVLAGHSYGGAVARLYAHTYPGEVGGLVLVDSFTPELRANFPAELWPLWKKQNAVSPETLKDYPDVERFDFDQTIDILRDGGTIRDIPLVVLTADAPITDVPKPGLPDLGPATQAAHHAAQEQLAKLAAGAEHVTKTDSGHNMMLENPAVVSAGIDDVVAAVRDGRSTVLPVPATGADGRVDGLVDVGGGRSIYARCSGSGSPTVVLIAGKGNGADDWMQVLDPADPVQAAPGDDLAWTSTRLLHSDEAVLPQVARSTRVCAYDRPDVRAGGDVTTPRAQPHTVDVDVSDLRALTRALGEEDPVVLVAHSYGGFIADLYARTYPADVAGLVMVDPGSPTMADVASGPALRTWDDDNAQTSPQAREGVQLLDAIARITAAPPMPKVPAVVLVADKPWRTDLLPAELRERDAVSFADWQTHVARLALDLDAKLITETNSGHAIYLYNPALVVDAIRGVVDVVRSGK